MQTQPLPNETPKKKSNLWKWLLGGIFGLYVLGRLGGSGDTATRAALVTTTDTTSTMPGEAGGALSTEPASPPAETANWTFYDDEDKMGAKSKVAVVAANEELQFEFPYNGGSEATFTVRKKGGSTDIMLRVTKGQFIIPYDGGSCRIRFDKGSPVRYTLTGASDHSSDIVFIGSEQSLIKKLKKAKTMVVEAEFYREGRQQMEFNVAEFKW